jgi:hypothetical protein
MSDSQKFVDMLHNVPWEDGLKDDVLRGTVDLIFWCLTPFSAIFQLYHGDQFLVVEEA